MLTRTLNQISASASSQEAGSPAGANPFERGFPGNNTTSLVTVDDDGFKLLSLDSIMRMLNIHAEAIIRCVELSDPQNL